MKQQRTVIVMLVAVVTAGIASFGVYRAIRSMPVREVEVPGVKVVVASGYIPVGTRLTKNHLRVATFPARNPVPGAFADPEQLVDRGVVATLDENEPITANKVAGPEAGAGLPPVIPAGMRAMSVRVNEVIGVAGFVLPGTRVDVIVTVSDDGDGSGPEEAMSRTVLSNVVVLTAGTRYDQDRAKDGQAQRSTVITLAVLPEDAERVALATSEGTISLALRNPVDVDQTKTTGIRFASLMKGTGPEVVVDRPRQRVVAVRPPAPPKPVEPVVPAVYRVETIRGAKRAEEVVR
ncbi:MAG: Flp pilus assembly protein CpaB [Acidobacteria bacterium]|nr:Flp pilus assembly protein CpaB [Acidobacteriota bacterium]